MVMRQRPFSGKETRVSKRRDDGFKRQHKSPNTMDNNPREEYFNPEERYNDQQSRPRSSSMQEDDRRRVSFMNERQDRNFSNQGRQRRADLDDDDAYVNDEKMEENNNEGRRRLRNQNRERRNNRNNVDTSEGALENNSPSAQPNITSTDTKVEKKFSMPSANKIKSNLFASIYMVIFVIITIMLPYYIYVQDKHFTILAKKQEKLLEKAALQGNDPTKTAGAVIDVEESITAAEDKKDAPAPKVGKIDGKPDLFILSEVIPKKLASNKLMEVDFLTYIANVENRADFCSFVDKALYLFADANAELRNYSKSNYPLAKSFSSFADCISENKWTAAELKILYDNIYDDFIKLTNNNQTMIVKLTKTSSHKGKNYFNVIEDLPAFLVKNSNIISEPEFTQLLGNQINMLNFCRYSNLFAKSYALYVAKQGGVLETAKICTVNNLQNMKEAHAQYAFYHSYTRPDSPEEMAKELQSSYIEVYNK